MIHNIRKNKTFKKMAYSAMVIYAACHDAACWWLPKLETLLENSGIILVNNKSISWTILLYFSETQRAVLFFYLKPKNFSATGWFWNVRMKSATITNCSTAVWEETEFGFPFDTASVRSSRRGYTLLIQSRSGGKHFFTVKHYFYPSCKVLY